MRFIPVRIQYSNFNDNGKRQLQASYNDRFMATNSIIVMVNSGAVRKTFSKLLVNPELYETTDIKTLHERDHIVIINDTSNVTSFSQDYKLARHWLFNLDTAMFSVTDATEVISNHSKSDVSSQVEQEEEEHAEGHVDEIVDNVQEIVSRHQVLLADHKELKERYLEADKARDDLEARAKQYEQTIKQQEEQIKETTGQLEASVKNQIKQEENQHKQQMQRLEQELLKQFNEQLRASEAQSQQKIDELTQELQLSQIRNRSQEQVSGGMVPTESSEMRNNQPVAVLNTVKIAAKRIEPPHFHPEAHSIDDILTKLRQMVKWANKDDAAQLIFGFASQPSLSAATMDFDPELFSLDRFDDFCNELRKIFGSYCPIQDFQVAQQNPGEDENLYLKRLQRLYMRKKEVTDPKDLVESDKKEILHKFKTSLISPEIVRKLLEFQDIITFDNVAEKAKMIRMAKVQSERINQNTAMIVKSDKNCEKCGRGHATEDCRANPKNRASFNKIKNSHSHRNNRSFIIPQSHGAPNNRQDSNQYPPAIRPQDKKVRFNNNNNFRRHDRPRNSNWNNKSRYQNNQRRSWSGNRQQPRRYGNNNRQNDRYSQNKPWQNRNSMPKVNLTINDAVEPESVFEQSW